jgi:hypothetical protein
MDTASRGRVFEERVHRAIKAALDHGDLGLMPQMATAHIRKAYYSRDRSTPITVDVSIELWLPGAKRWSLLWAWECKDYNSPVPASDVEEFWAKLTQIAGSNIKGGIATTGPLQAGAVRFAESKGLAIVRVSPSDDMEWISHARSEQVITDHGLALLGSTQPNSPYGFLGVITSTIYPSWPSLLRKGLGGSGNDGPSPTAT